MKLNSEPKIIGMANALDLDSDRPVEAIMEYCRTRVAKFLRRAGRIANVVDLQKLICERLNLAVHEIWSDPDIDQVASHYLEQGEIAAFGAVKTQLRQDTFGMITQLERRDSKGRARFVAFIDCRGDKHQRRVWTLWHEIAHCLTTNDQMALPLQKRTTAEMIEKDPVEKLTDIIAGDFAFYEPFFRPVLDTELGRSGRLTFRVVEGVRSRFNPEASFVSTLNACVAKTYSPVILIEAGLAFRVGEQRQIQSGMASPADFAPSLRILRSVPNEAARIAMPHVPKQMRVPEGSIIARVHALEFEALVDGSSEENLRDWTTSSGGRLPNVEVAVDARKFGEKVVALISRAAA
jgi:hypothetical protein